jgi:hypothetical protein
MGDKFRKNESIQLDVTKASWRIHMANGGPFDGQFDGQVVAEISGPGLRSEACALADAVGGQAAATALKKALVAKAKAIAVQQGLTEDA